MHGGTVEAISAGEGCGSAFTIRLRRLESLQTPDELPGLGASFGIP